MTRAHGGSPGNLDAADTLSAQGEDAPLPALQDALLDASTLQQLFADVQHSAEQVAVAIKWSARGQTPEVQTTLADAELALTNATAFGVQLRYLLGDTLWFDTLLRTPAGVRLVRIGHPAESFAK